VPIVPKVLGVIQVWLPVAAFVLSIASLVSQWYNNRQQNRKWEIVNQPRFELLSPVLAAFEDLTYETATTRKWGYAPLLFSIVKDNVATGWYRLYCDLELSQSTLGRRLPGTAVMRTIDDARREIDRLQLRGVVIRKHFQIRFSFRNAGTLPARNLTLAISRITENMHSEEQIFSSTSPLVEVVPGETFSAVVDFSTPIDASLMDTLFHIQMRLPPELTQTVKTLLTVR
jgi:hypothetical protein